MSEMEQIIIQIAENCKRLDESIYRLKESFKVLPDKKGDFFLQFGLILYKFSYIRLALNPWYYALEYVLENRDRDGESKCYTNLGIYYYNLGDSKKQLNITVPYYSGKILHPKVLKSIIRDANLTVEKL